MLILWINVTQYLSIIKKTFKKDINEIKSIYIKLGPILQCYFILYKVIFEQENEINNSN
jgi:hypothetical protein